MKRLSIGLALVLLVFAAVVGVAVASLLRGGISARIEPAGVEAVIARKLRRLGIPRSARRLASPVPSSRESLDAGRAHFADHCAVCHANDGSGNTEMGRHLYPRAPDLRLPETQQLADGELFYIIENGVRLTGMPAWGDGSDEDRVATWQLVHFIRHLPGLTSREKLEMERLNPKGPEEWREMEEDERFLKGKEPSSHEGTHRH